jgi:hypothetical protein
MHDGINPMPLTMHADMQCLHCRQPSSLAGRHINVQTDIHVLDAVTMQLLA